MFYGITDILSPEDQVNLLEKEINNKKTTLDKKEKEIIRLTMIAENEKRTGRDLYENLRILKAKLEKLLTDFEGSASSQLRLTEIDKILSMSTEQMSSELLNDKINTLTLELSKLKDLEEKKDIELARVQRIIDEHSQISMLLRQKVEELKNEYSIEKKKKQQFFYKKEIEPVQIDFCQTYGEATNITTLKFTQNHSFAISNDGEFYVSYGLVLPKSIPSFTKVKENFIVKQISCGTDHTLIIDDIGRLFSFGSNTDCQLGIPNVNTSSEFLFIPSFSGKVVSKIAAGSRHSLALVGHDLWSWGCGKNYRLGDGHTSNVAEPKLLKTGLKLIDVSCGWSHSLLRTVEGYVYSFGKGSSGQCGHGVFEDSKVPTFIKSLEKYNIKSVCGGYDHTLCISDAGELFSFGGATEGQLGHKELVNISEPKKISAFEEKFVVSINSGPFHSVATCVGSSTSSSESLGRLDVYIWGKVGKFKDYAPHMIESLKRKCLLNVSCNIKTTVAIINSKETQLSPQSLQFRVNEERLSEKSTIQVELKYGVIGIQGARNTMEDAHTAIPRLKLNNSFASYFAVFDGYGGTAVAKYCQEQMHLVLTKHLNSVNDPIEALKATFAEVDKNFLEKAEKENIQGGSTATIALILGTHLYLANVGDSEAVLSRSGKAVPLTIVHNMHKNLGEEQRIKKIGGVVYHKRLGHPSWNPAIVSIAVTRAIGDAFYKTEKYTSSKLTGLISIPDIAQVQLTNAEEFLIVACDGLWAVVTPQEAVDFVLSHLKESNNPQSISKELAAYGAEKGSLDNITVMIIALHDKFE